MSKMSITRGLAELKSLAERIDEATKTGMYVAVLKGKNDRRTVHNSPKAIDTVTAEINASFQKVAALLLRRQAIKKAIIESNATVKVKIGAEEMTVAEAIERKNSIGLQATFYQFLRKGYIDAANAVTNGNRVLDDQIEKAVIAAYGNDSKNKPSAEAYAAVAEPRRNDHELSLLDPQNITTKIDELAVKLNTFSMEVDFVLSESNARNEIEVAD